MEPDASDSTKYAPQRHTAIHIYNIPKPTLFCKSSKETNKKCFFYFRQNIKGYLVPFEWYY